MMDLLSTILMVLFIAFMLLLCIFALIMIIIVLSAEMVDSNKVKHKE